MCKAPKQPLETSEIRLVKLLHTLELLTAINRKEEPVVSIETKAPETPNAPTIVTGPDPSPEAKESSIETDLEAEASPGTEVVNQPI